ncbi:MAG: hypothetical protein Q8P83_03745 [bacterium]|nr:hypothetical protein [bacterium]
MKTVCILALFFIPALALAAGLDVSPGKIDLETSKQEVKITNIIVANPTADVQVFEVFADDFQNLFTFAPASFTLEAGERTTVRLTFNPKTTNSELLSTNISVLSSPLAESKFNANTGVKIATTVRILETSREKSMHQDIIFFGLLGLALIFLIYQFIKKAKPTLL